MECLICHLHFDSLEMSTLDLLDPQQWALSGPQAFADLFLGGNRTVVLMSFTLDCVSMNWSLTGAALTWGRRCFTWRDLEARGISCSELA